MVVEVEEEVVEVNEVRKFKEAVDVKEEVMEVKEEVVDINEVREIEGFGLLGGGYGGR